MFIYIMFFVQSWLEFFFFEIEKIFIIINMLKIISIFTLRILKKSFDMRNKYRQTLYYILYRLFFIKIAMYKKDA
jgi:hypothetical protein